MDFFEQQDLAKRNTLRLVLLLVSAVISLIVITCVFLAFFFYYFAGNNPLLVEQRYSDSLLLNLWNSLSVQTILTIAIGITLVVILGGLFKYSQLRGGGRAVAAAMGGRLISGLTQDPDERKILNVVEEMAIASGTAVPPVYVMEEDAINAFAAGFHPQDAVIGITRGCIRQLTRDELQGVIAHEFSHIFHGDMRLNMRLIATLHGILLIGLVGEFLLRHGSRRRVRSSKDSGNGIVVLGLGLFIIGYTGIFFGNLIKAAVSRQREFLADASAVQFTRNPDGIAGALKKIGGAIRGSQLTRENAAEFSHMYFSQGIKSFTNLMATHPPLETRIRRIQPRWDGKFITAVTPLKPTASQTAGYTGFINTPNAQQTAMLAAVDAQIQQIAQPTQEHIAYARQQLTQIPQYIKEATADSFSARGLVLGLIMDRHHSMRDQQWQLLRRLWSEEHLNTLKPIADKVKDLSPALRLPLLELCLPTLKQLTQTQRDDFLQGLQILIQADNKISLLEWSLYRIVLHNTTEHSPQRQRDLQDLNKECQLLLSMLAYAGAPEQLQAQAAFTQAVTHLDMAPMPLLPKSSVQLAALDTALEQLNLVRPLQKPRLLKAMGECVLHDQRVSVDEAELFRAIADSLDCPVPPFIQTTGPM
ncbi:M48 family metallopeptidase [Cellvibrio japonicus]|uniref:Zn-dependent protease with chaperone function n=1 Tax=Cellvibrio japonicus (strain Ueda107) TaxID=498211 RepID=B3PL98_CELJU|nr:M48 family metallopeptidase [Cellvibrio japonicus]ACE84561.1 Zn-dependent protease with chaperone function [Cellvibrio japonicus Ueda107]QEI11556.1 M48 family metallopeptidase [Cellvibrio japonicus]QEI15130.1 M48 family metallopeptidase [Cellvibrio japonicus]QEI18710.1 M48 family metallopeptidase [Cellvibrio japonicus]